MPTNMKYDNLPPYAEEMYQKFLDNPELFNERSRAEFEKAVHAMSYMQSAMDSQELILEALIGRAKL